MNYFQYFQDGGSFQSFLITLPQNLQYTGDYDMERYWELNGKPANFEEGIKKTVEWYKNNLLDKQKGQITYEKENQYYDSLLQ